MREEIIQLRKTIEEMKQANEPTPSPDYHRVIKRDLRFEMTVAAPARALAAQMAAKEKQEEEARLEKERVARLEQEEQARKEKAASAQEQQQSNQAAIQAKSPKASFNSIPSFTTSTSASSSFDKPQTPSANSSWNFNIFSSAKSFFNRRKSETSFEQQQEHEHEERMDTQPDNNVQSQPEAEPARVQSSSQNKPQTESSRVTPQTQPKTQSRSVQQNKIDGSAPVPVETTSPVSPNMTPTKTPSTREQSRRSRQQHQTPQSEETPSHTPARSVRRRGLFPGSANRPARPASARKQKPVEPNADKREKQMQDLAAEREIIAREHAASQKRIQENAKMLEEEKKRAEQAQQKLDEEAVAAHTVGNKRKRVKIDDLKSIPARLPGQSSGCFSFREEFFTYNDDSDDDYVEMDVDEADELLSERPAKKMKIQDNVFQAATTPQKPTPSPATPMPSTPIPATSQNAVSAIERQKIQASTYKPKKPSGLSQVYSGSSPLSAGPTPRQISAATPAPRYYNQTPGAPLTDITERTEPDTPARAVRTPSPVAVTPTPVTATPKAATTPPSNPFNFPQGVPLWIAYPHIYTEELVKQELAVPMTEAEIDAATAVFAAGCSARLADELSSPVQAAS